MRNLFTLLLALSSISALAQQTTGLFQYDWQTEEGLVLWNALQENYSQYLINNCGEVVHSWTTPGIRPANSMYLMEDGTIIYPAKSDTALNNPITGGGGGERIRQMDWDGTLMWDYIYYDGTKKLHHDIAVMPNGNVLAIAWVVVDSLDCIAAGRSPALLTDGVLWTESVIEVEPTGPTSGNIVWQWDLWDHLIQDFDQTKDNFGVVADHPELLDLNYENPYLGVENIGRDDFVHLNAIDYNADLNQIVLSSQVHSEVWIIDHSTTTQEAASHTGGSYGKGGDFLYRYGNPQVYDRGNAADQKLWRQHDSYWIPEGYPDGGGIMIYNNGLDRSVSFSEVDVIDPPQSSPGVYTLGSGEPYGPEDKTWNYHAEDSVSFYSRFISGAKRSATGSTLICEGQFGRIFEVTYDGQKVWEYVSPVTSGGILSSTEEIPVGNFPDNAVFRATKYPLDYPGFDGHSLSSGVQLEANPFLSSCVVGVEDFVDDGTFQVYPNPTEGQLTLEGISGAQVEVFDQLGRMVMAYSVSSEREELNLSGQDSGLYLIRVVRNGNAISRRVIVQ